MRFYVKNLTPPHFPCLQGNTLNILEDGDVLSQVASGAMPLMVVYSDHDHNTIDDLLEHNCEVQNGKVSRMKENLEQVLSKLNRDGGLNIAGRVPIVVVRALAFEGIMEAWGSPRLKLTQKQKQVLLEKTGAANLYSSMSRLFKCVSEGDTFIWF